MGADVGAGERVFEHAFLGRAREHDVRAGGRGAHGLDRGHGSVAEGFDCQLTGP